jgi:hypothetical protein
MEMTKEIWTDLKGWEGVYMISNNVKSLSRFTKCKNNKLRLLSERLMKLSINNYGYVVISLRKDNYIEMCIVHRAVGEAFIDNPDNKPEINHKNGIKSDNRVDNLEWVTGSENMKHSFDVLKRKTSGAVVGDSWLRGKKGELHPCFGMKRKGRFGSEHPRSRRVKCDTLGLEFESGCIAAKELCVSQALVSNICNGVKIQTFGLTFRYI